MKKPLVIVDLGGHEIGPDGFWCWARHNGVMSPKFRTPEELERWKQAGGPEIHKMRRRAGLWHAVAWMKAIGRSSEME